MGLSQFLLSCLPPACRLPDGRQGRQGRQACTMILRFAQDFWLKYQVPIAIGTTRMLRRVTQPPHIAGPFDVTKTLHNHENH